MTGTAIINAALTEIGILGAGQTPDSADSELGREKLNRLLNRWATKRRLVFFKDHASYVFTTSKQSYTIGPASTTPDFTATRPVKIEHANVLLVSSTPEIRVPLEVINTTDYAALGIPALSSSFPSKLYYQPTVSKGTLWPWPYPTDTANKLELFTWNQLAEIAAGSVGVDYPLPPGYQDAIIYSLAESLAPSFGKSLTPELARAAQQARADAMGNNSAPPKMDLRTSGLGPSPAGRLEVDFQTGWF